MKRAWRLYWGDGPARDLNVIKAVLGLAVLFAALSNIEFSKQSVALETIAAKQALRGQ